MNRPELQWVRDHSELLVSIVLLALLATCVQPLASRMPNAWDDLVLVLIIAAFGLYAGIIYRERSRDEREQLHRSSAGRGGFLVGTGLLVVFIVLDALGRPVDKGMIWVLGAMVLTKLLLLAIAKRRG
ncbi:MAG: hypothetical protein ACOC0D_10315 [Spirochaeta sp.]